jgi:methylphosphotriester-DNA--protein-cysteine methyltransferase
MPTAQQISEADVTVTPVPRSMDLAKREELLAAAGAVLARTGLAETSLRSLAAEMGTSARMLVYYFGSKEHLTLEVMNRQQRAAGNGVLTTGMPAPAASAATTCGWSYRSSVRPVDATAPTAHTHGKPCPC